MDNTREKLIELLEMAVDYSYILRKLKSTTTDACEDPFIAMADLLIANGVTVQEWIPVTERLPEDGVLVLCIGKKGGMFLGISPSLFSDGTCYFAVPNARSCRYGTHWMTLPQPPKEG